MNFPDKTYSVIYADPPWSYKQHGTGPKSRGNAEQHYHTMRVEDICNLPVQRLAGGGGRMRTVYVGNIPDNTGCPESYGCLGICIQNGGFCVGQKEREKQYELLGNGGLHKGECRSLLARRNSGIQSKPKCKKPFCASSDRSAGASSQRKARRNQKKNS